jgi:type I restriction enzyme, R subunit
MPQSLNKRELSERDICTKFITPALKQAGWDVMQQIREEVTFTDGQILVRGKTVKRGNTKRADYILYYKPNLPLAIVEAKDNLHGIGDGMQQALEYGEMLDVPFIFSSNGDAFLFRDNSGQSDELEQELSLNAFPSPEELWQKYRRWKNLDDDQANLVTQDYYSDGSGKEPRYYQRKAINRVIEAVAKGQDRLLLVMATGTGKTYTAFQIIWRLWKSGAKKRILFLADRNILVDQTKTNDFKPFGSAMTKVQNREADKSYEVYLSLYQAMTGPEEIHKTYKKFSPDFFDLIVIDECHRGSAKDDSEWREILEYFSGATQLGLTATPKETKYISNIDYFGEPVYTYSLKQGIQDGFLAPYKVIRINLDKDLGWRPSKGQKDKYGQDIPDREYNVKDMDQEVILEKRNLEVANKVTQYLQATDPYNKTIVFCEDIAHAERMRQALVNANPDLAAKSRKYVMRITGDNEQGKAELDNFIMPESPYPVIATTSQLMSTGVDAQTCKLVVLDKNINSLTEFKQIIGRGTRINEAFEKLYFTIIDFRNATKLFADPEFDGDPVVIYEPEDTDPVVPPEPPADDGGNPPVDPPPGRTRYYVDNVPVSIVNERVQYLDADGKLITESLKDYTRKRVNDKYERLSDFLRDWSQAEKKQAVVRELEKQGVIFEALQEEIGQDFDAFDLICHVAFDQPPLSRRERAENVKKRNYFAKYTKQAQHVLHALLDLYADGGLESLEDSSSLKVPPISHQGSPLEIIQSFGGPSQFRQALSELSQALYE